MRKYVAYLALAATLVFLPVVLFSWWSEPLYGDLTRIGRWTEHDFGPNAVHAPIKVKSNVQTHDRADVMVLGDSFSLRNLWQSTLSDKTGYVVQTSRYGKSDCIPNWLEEAIADKTSKIVIIETVERLFVERFRQIARCSGQEPMSVNVEAGIEYGRRPAWPLPISLSYTTISAINTIRSRLFDEKYSNGEGTVIAALRKGCALFSNRRNDRILYAFDDEVMKKKWQERDVRDAIENTMGIQKAVERSGKRFAFVLVPDKSSVYSTCLVTGATNAETADMNQRLIDAGVNAPDLQATFRKNIDVVVDLYDPDNTHWSESGYALAGETIGRYVSTLTAGH